MKIDCEVHGAGESGFRRAHSVAQLAPVIVGLCLFIIESRTSLAGSKATLISDFAKLNVEKIGLPKWAADPAKSGNAVRSALFDKIQSHMQSKGYTLVAPPYQPTDVQATLELDVVGKLRIQREEMPPELVDFNAFFATYRMDTRVHQRYSMEGTLKLLAPDAKKKTIYKNTFTRWRDFDLKTRDTQSVRETRERGKADKGKLVIGRGNGPASIVDAIPILAEDLVMDLPARPGSSAASSAPSLRYATKDDLEQMGSSLSSSYHRLHGMLYGGAVEALEQRQFGDALKKIEECANTCLPDRNPFDENEAALRTLESYLLGNLHAVILAEKGDRIKARDELTNLCNVFPNIKVQCPPYAERNLDALKELSKRK